MKSLIFFHRFAPDHPRLLTYVDTQNSNPGPEDPPHPGGEPLQWWFSGPRLPFLASNSSRGTDDAKTMFLNIPANA